MIEEDWKRIAGMHVTDVGDISVVWMALDKETDTLHLYDCANFRQQPWAVIGEGISARGKYIPMAWSKKAKPIRDELEKRGINVIRDGIDESDALAEVTSETITNRMKTRRFKIAKSCVEVKDEWRNFIRDDAKVPRDSHPLMAATRNAVSMLDWARPLRRKVRRSRKLAPKLAIV